MKTSLLATFAVLFSLAGCTSNIDSTITQKEVVVLSNKDKAVALLNSFNTGDQTPISYINPDKIYSA